VLEIERRAQALGRPEVSDGLLRLIGIDPETAREVPAWLAAWARAFDAASPSTADPRLAPCRRSYHLAGYQALAEAGRPDAVVIPLLLIWDRTMRVLEAYGQAAPFRPAWEEALHRLGLSNEALNPRALELESYLDAIETLIEAWAVRNGA
jgi:hypothetical protein